MTNGNYAHDAIDAEALICAAECGELRSMRGYRRANGDVRVVAFIDGERVAALLSPAAYATLLHAQRTAIMGARHDRAVAMARY